MEVRGGKLFRTREERREIVLETLQSGKSVAQIALEHGINANQIFQWRRQYRENLLDGAKPEQALVPVTISSAVEKRPPAGRSESKPSTSGIIHIDLGHARVRIEGAADEDCVRATLEGLRR